MTANYNKRMAEQSLRQLILEMGRNFSDQLRSMDEKFEKKFDIVEQRLDTIDGRLDNIDLRLGTVDQRLHTVDQRLDAADQRFDSIDRRLDESDKKLDTVIELVLDMQRNMVTRAEWKEVVSDTKVIKFAVTHLSEQLTRHVNDKHIHVNV